MLRSGRDSSRINGLQQWSIHLLLAPYMECQCRSQAEGLRYCGRMQHHVLCIFVLKGSSSIVVARSVAPA